MAPDYDRGTNSRCHFIVYCWGIACLVFLPMKPVCSNELSTDMVWSKQEQGVRIGLTIKNLVSDSINLRLCFSNTTSSRQRIYFVENDFFRSFQSYFMATDRASEIILLTRPSPPHGYVVGTKDFPLLDPESVFCFNKTLQLSGIDSKSITRLTWVYRNEIHRWQAGLPTFDGPTHHLFNENDNPDLWVGELQVEISLVE